MGDTGSLMLGFLLAVFGIRLLAIPQTYAMQGIHQQSIQYSRRTFVPACLWYHPGFQLSAWRDIRRFVPTVVTCTICCKNSLKSVGICITVYSTTILFYCVVLDLPAVEYHTHRDFTFAFTGCHGGKTLTRLTLSVRGKLEKAAVNIEDYRKHNQFVKTYFERIDTKYKTKKIFVVEDNRMYLPW